VALPKNADLKPVPPPYALQGMADLKNTDKNQPDKNIAADERPVPSQAEGDRQTIEEDLKEKEKERAKGAKQGQ
jgi:hypothetical protein